MSNRIIPAFLVFSLFVIIFSIQSADALFTPIIPAYQVQKIPTVTDFHAKTQTEFLGEFTPSSILRDNGEKIEAYILNSISGKREFIMVFYFEDSTDQKLQNYVPFNSDYFVMKFQTDLAEQPQYIYAERNGRGCLISDEMFNRFWDGSYTGCEGGLTDIKQTENGWAAYVKFFDISKFPTSEKPFSASFFYGDILKSEKGTTLEDINVFSWPKIFPYGKIIPISDTESAPIKANSGSITSNDFLYKPSKFLTQNLEKNTFDCADNTISVKSKKFTYEIDRDPIRIDVEIKSDLQDGSVFLDVFDSNDELVHHAQANTADGKTSFLFNLDTGKGAYTAKAEFGVDGPKDSAVFVIGDAKIVEAEEDECYFYLIYNESAKKLFVLAHIKDASHNGLDQIQIFVDRNGDSNSILNSDDFSFAVDKTNFGSQKFATTQGWTTEDFIKSDGYLYNKPDSYDVLIPVSQVSKNFRFSIEQIDYTGLELKSTRYPENGFAALPGKWSEIEYVSNSPKKWASDTSRPTEIFLKQTMDINLILVGDQWDSALQNKIKQKLTTNYKPIVLSELTRAGIEYKYNYNFISTDSETNQKVFDFMNEAADPVRPFYGEDDFENPWGFGPWIQQNHTDWFRYQTYTVEYRLIDAEEMENFLYENIILGDLQLTKSNAANLIFIADDMDKIEFLHNYKIRKPDTLNKNPHSAVGLMGYGGQYNFYFFDLYAVPWHEFLGFDFFYDKSLDNYATSLLDVTTDERYVRLISDYVNNATSLLITPAYLYDPVYKENYSLDLVLVADPKVGTGTVQVLSEYFIDTDKIESQLKELTPYSNWQISLQAENIKSANIPKSLKNAIAKKTTIPLIEGFDYGNVDILSSESLKKAVAEWAGTRQASQFKDFKNIQESSWIIPTIVVISDAYNEVYIDNYGGIGIAPAYPDDSRQPCCAFGVTTDDRVWNQKVSVTDLVLHEVGHVMGLMHPFQGFDKDDEYFRNEYFAKWYGSVMAYNSPNLYGCGFWYGVYFPGNCGISDTTFTKFERDNHARGVTAYLVEAANSNVYRTLLELENNGQEFEDLPELSKQRISNVKASVNKAKTAFSTNKIFGDNGAYKLALDAAIESSKFATSSGIVYEVEPKVKISLPDWIKNTITWWSEGSISEQEFVGALQYLIKEKIMILPDIPESNQMTTSRAVPDWVRTNAIWWTQDRISDNDFVSGLQFLIKEGIIRVN